jgi:translocation and assembly module TamA
MSGERLGLAFLLLCHLAAARAGLAVDVRITGLSGQLLDNVRAYLSIEREKSDPQLNKFQLERLNKRARDEIAKALQPFGYYHPRIDTDLRFSNGRWLAHYDIAPGPAVTIRDIVIRIQGDGADDPKFREQISKFPLSRGEVLNQPLYEQGKQNFLRYANDYGYFDFRWLKSEIAVDLQNNTAVISLIMDSGPRYDFGKVRFYQDVLDEDLMRRFLPFDSGEPFAAAKLLELQNALLDSDYFKTVDINPRRNKTEDHRIPIDVTLTPRPQQLFTVGAGYGTDTGLRGKLGWEARHINHKGHRFTSEYKLSQIQDSLTARYIIPIRNPRTDQLAITSSWIDDHPEFSTSETYLLGLSRSVDHGNNWLQTVYLNYQTERFSVAGESGNSLMLMPGITWTKVSADNRIYPERGLYLLLDVRGAHPALLSNVQFLQVQGQGKFIHKLFGDARILLRGQVGATRSGSIRALPTSVRFFAGGDQSVRGYDYQSLGPRNAAGQVVGGEQLLVGSVEFEQRFTHGWSGAVFYDVGNAINSWQEALKAGAGFGVRWRSPVGPVRIDLAFPISEPDAFKHPHPYISVGPDL